MQASLPPDIRNNLFGQAPPAKRQIDPIHNHSPTPANLDDDFKPSLQLPDFFDPSHFNLPLEESTRMFKRMQARQDEGEEEQEIEVQVIR